MTTHRFWTLLTALLFAFAVSGAPCAHGAPLGQGEQSFLPSGDKTADAAMPVQSGIFEGLRSWVLSGHAQLHRRLEEAVSALKPADPWIAALFLAALSFAYGVLHAAGPGHGKAVISSYVLATRRTAWRGVLLSFLTALVQALSAIALVAMLWAPLKAAELEPALTEARLETFSWGLVALVGLWLLYGQLRHLRAARRTAERSSPGDFHIQLLGRNVQDHSPDCLSCCGHAHIPGPAELEDGWCWRRAFALAFAVGIRPCSGAVVVQFFALGQGLLWAGVLATFAMAIGTALTVSAFALLAVSARGFAVRAASGDRRKLKRFATFASLAGSASILALGVLLFIVSLNGTGQP